MMPIPALALFIFMTLGAGRDVTVRQQDEERPSGGLVTLYALDPLARSLSFEDGAYGQLFQDHVVKNRDSHIDFCGYHEGEFKVGIQGGESGLIVDLGSQYDLRKRYGYLETVGGGQGFASIRCQGDEIVILKDYAEQTTQPLVEANNPAHADDHTPVELDHVYIVRIHGSQQAPGILVKLLVVQLVPGQSVTIRWQRL
jgi:hypothetical protein